MKQYASNISARMPEARQQQRSDPDTSTGANKGFPTLEASNTQISSRLGYMRVAGKRLGQVPTSRELLWLLTRWRHGAEQLSVLDLRLDA